MVPGQYLKIFPIRIAVLEDSKITLKIEGCHKYIANARNLCRPLSGEIQELYRQIFTEYLISQVVKDT